MAKAQLKLYHVLAILVFLALLPVPGCSDDTEGPKTDGPTADGGQDGSAGVSHTFVVVERSVGTDSDSPLQGATVAFDPPGGGPRVEKKTNADGKVTFDGVDWSAGDATVTAHLDGHRMESWIGFNPSWIAGLPSVRLQDGLLVLRLIDQTPPESVSCSGTVKGLTDSSHRVVVNVVRTLVGSEWQGWSSGTFQVTVPKGEPFTLQGIEVTHHEPSGQSNTMEIHRVMHKDFPATTQDMTGVELDFAADEVATQTADLTAPLPARAESPVRAASPFCYVGGVGSAYTFGWGSQVEIQPAQDRLAASLVWTTPSWAKETLTFCSITNTDTKEFAYLSERGYPKAGALEPILDAPKWVTPASAATAHPLHSKMEWELFDTGIHAYVMLVKGTQSVWIAFAGKDATSVTLPDPPSSVNETALFGTGNLAAVIGAERYDKMNAGTYRLTQSQGRIIKP